MPPTCKKPVGLGAKRVLVCTPLIVSYLFFVDTAVSIMRDGNYKTCGCKDTKKFEWVTRCSFNTLMICDLCNFRSNHGMCISNCHCLRQLLHKFRCIQ